MSRTQAIHSSQNLVIPPSNIYKCTPDVRDFDIYDINLPASVVIDGILSCTQLGEGVFVPGANNQDDEKKEPCKRIYLHAFRGARDDASVLAFKQSIKQHEEAQTNGPSGPECLLYTGHVGVSFDAKSPIYGFNPDTGDLAGWQVIKKLKSREASKPYPGIVTDDTAVFSMAKSKGLDYKVLEYVFPESKYKKIQSAFKFARKKTGLTYSFPKQGGDCNCATWPSKIGLSIPCSDGAMKAYMNSFKDKEIRRTGECSDK